MASSIYQPTFPSPRNQARDMSINQIFTVVVDGSTIDAYRLRIFNNSTNAQIYDSTKVSLGTNLFDGDTLSVTIPANTVTNGTEAKWTLEYFNGTESAISQEIFFIASANPTFTITVPSTITSQSFEFVGTYSQAQNIPIQSWFYILYDAEGNAIITTDTNFSGNIRHTFEGLISNTSYQLQGFGTTQQNVEFQTIRYTFNVQYAEPSIITIPTAVPDSDRTAMTVGLGELVILNGTTTGTFEYINNFLVDGNIGLKLNSGSSISYSRTVPTDFSHTFFWQPVSTSFSGRIIRLDNSGSASYYEVGYQNGRFYYEISGLRQYTDSFDLANNKVFLIAILPTRTIIIERIIT